MATDTLATPAGLSDSQTRVFKNFIDGEWVDSSTGETFENRNPADTRDLVGIFQKSGKADVDAAVAAAKAAFAKWRLVPAPRRAEIVFRAAEILIERKEDYARDMTREMGKVLAETRGDVQEAIDAAYYNAGEGRRLFGPTVPSEMPNKFAMAVRQPIGICGMITPWNFPDGHLVMEAASGSGLREHVRDQARAGHAPLDFQSGSCALRCRASEGRHQHRHRIWPGGRHAAGRASRCARDLADRIVRGGTHRGRHRRAKLQALLARTRRQKSDDRAG